MSSILNSPTPPHPPPPLHLFIAPSHPTPIRLKLVLVTGEGSDAQTVECTTLSQLSDYSQPHAPAALLKAAFICAKIVEFPSSLSLEEQLSSKYGCGFMLQAISNLPQGSGRSFTSNSLTEQFVFFLCVCIWFCFSF